MFAYRLVEAKAKYSRSRTVGYEKCVPCDSSPMFALGICPLFGSSVTSKHLMSQTRTLGYPTKSSFPYSLLLGGV